MDRSSGLVAAEILWDDVEDRAAYPYSIPALRGLGRLDLSASATFLVGENGSGKSTLLEAIALAAGLNAEGGSRNLRFSQRPTESDLYRHLRLSWATQPGWAYFLRAETFFNTATAYEDIGHHGQHHRSHGQQFLATAEQMLRPGGVHLLDEPESALSVVGQLSFLRRFHDVAAGGGQVVVATHSPILLALPGATIYELTDDGVERVDYVDSSPYRLTRSFLDDPDRFLRHLMDDT